LMSLPPEEEGFEHIQEVAKNPCDVLLG